VLSERFGDFIVLRRNENAVVNPMMIDVLPHPLREPRILGLYLEIVVDGCFELERLVERRDAYVGVSKGVASVLDETVTRVESLELRECVVGEFAVSWKQTKWPSEVS
jgi:hypothetical protein